jgi:outer membrane receptor for ferrienterochelin and colicin
MTILRNLLLAVILSSVAISAGTKIKGIVSDVNNGNPLIGANVYLIDTELDSPTQMGSATDVDGSYTIDRIPIGNYTLVSFYIGYEEYREEFKATPDANITMDISLSPSAIQLEETKVTGTRRQQKVTEAPASIEIVSQRDIKRQSTTNLGSYLKGLKGVDFTSSGINNYSISIRGFNSSFSSRLLTLTDGRVANIPALRVINYSTIPQSTDDIEKMEVVIGPATALYGANAHSGVVNIISKSPANSEGITISASGTNDERELRKLNVRWAKRLSNKISMKVSGSLLHAYEWPYISEYEHKSHSYPWTGNPSRVSDGKDNNPWSTPNSIPFQEADYSGLENWVCIDEAQTNCKLVGDGERNDTGDPDEDGFMGEDWVNGYDDDGDGLIDEDYFEADGIDNDGDGAIDENIDLASDKWYDGIDNNENGVIDDGRELDPGRTDAFSSDWSYDLEERNIIINGGRKHQMVNGKDNPWYINYDASSPICSEGINDANGDCVDIHLRGDFYYDEDNVTLLFDNYEFDYGIDGLPGDMWVDLPGDGQFSPGEGLSNIGTFGTLQDVGLDGIAGTNDEGEGDGIWQPGDGWVDTNGNGIADLGNFGETGFDTYNSDINEDYYNDVWPPKNGSYDIGEPIFDYGQDGLPNTGDPGESDGEIHILDENEGDGIWDTGDGQFGGESDYKDNFQRVNDVNGDGLDDFPDFEVDNRKIEMRLDYDFNEDLNLTFQSGYSTTKTQQVTGTSRYLADGYEYTFYQLRSRYKNWFAQVYLNQANSGNTRGYNQGNVIHDESRNIAAQLQNNIDFYSIRTKLVWGFDYFRTEPNTFGTILNDGPNGYDNNANFLTWSTDGIDNDGDGLVDELICDDGFTGGLRDGKMWDCGEGIDEKDEFVDPTTNELGLYFQTKTNIWDNDVLQLITAARFDYHDILTEGVQFGPKLGLTFKPTESSTFRFTYGKAFNTPTSIALNTDLFIRRFQIFDIYLRGNKNGTPYRRVDDTYTAWEPGYYFENGFESITPSDIPDDYFEGYSDRVNGAPYFFNFRDQVPVDMIPLDTSRYVIFVPELNDNGVLYTPTESMQLKDVEPLRTEKIRTFEMGYKGFLFNRIITSIDYYISFYEDFFSPPTVITPLVAQRKFDSYGNDITNIDDLEIVGMIPASEDYLNWPYGTMWNGQDDDGDWETYADAFGWRDDDNGDGNPVDPGEWGFVDLNGNLFSPDTVMWINEGAVSFGEYEDAATFWNSVGVDEYSPQTGLSEAEPLESFFKDADGNVVSIPGIAMAPPHIVLSPLNYGDVKMQGIDYDITYLLPEYKLFLSANLSWYGTTKYFNELTRKEDPINAPEWKWNLNAKLDTDFGDFTFSYRHVDEFEWKDGIWSGILGPYNLFDIHYNYKVAESLKFNLSAMNVLDDIHRELVGGAKMGRQIVMRISSEF